MLAQAKWKTPECLKWAAVHTDRDDLDAMALNDDAGGKVRDSWVLQLGSQSVPAPVVDRRLLCILCFVCWLQTKDLSQHAHHACDDRGNGWLGLRKAYWMRDIGTCIAPVLQL
jgi:hypothetical protein